VKDTLSNIASVVLIACALTVTGLVVRNEWTRSNRSAPAPPAADLPPVKVSGWNDVMRGGTSLSKRGAPVTIVEYSDFQCPFCATVVPTLRTLQEKYGDRLTVVFRHFPIESIHPYAKPAAIAAECAGQQGKFEAYHDALFAAQESIGKVSWRNIAASVGVAELNEFDHCVRDERYAERVAQDLRSGIRIGVPGTPTIVVNGMRLRGPPTEEAIAKQIDLELGTKPVAGR
jgi:protein-disulfide isomerase